MNTILDLTIVGAALAGAAWYVVRSFRTPTASRCTVRSECGKCSDSGLVHRRGLPVIAGRR